MKYIASLAILGAGLTMVAASQSELPAGAVARGDNGAVLVSTPKGVVEITPVNDNIFRVTALPKDSTVKYYPSQSAILTPEQTGVIEIVTPAEVVLKSESMKVVVNRQTGAVSFYDADGKTLLSEAEGVENDAAVKRISFLGADSGNLFGAGERGHRARLNGDSLSMFNRQNYGYTKGDPRISQMGISVPYFVSDKGYGVLFDDYNKADLYLGGDTISYTSATPRALSYYFINSPEGDIAGATANYSLLTGRQPLPPMWTLGYITSKYGYHNQAETEGVIDTLKTRGYPVDGIVLDLYWYGTETDMGRLEWNKEQWPDHRKMLADLKEKGVNMVLISQPYMNKKGAIDNYNYLGERGMLAKDDEGNIHDVTTWVGDAGMIDVSNPETREWYWNRYKDLTAEGVAGWWGDLGEPEVHPLTIRHANGQTASEYHNVYGNEWSRIIYEGLRKDYPEMRPMLMMRGGTAGLQRYGVFPWTTDVSRSWGGFGPQVNLMLSSGLSGLGYMSSDIGGFAVDPANPVDAELYVRWLQMGTFTPMLRTHATVKPEPYHYPAEEKILKDYIKMRYRWLPYNYTLAWENAVKGWPLARPLNFHGENSDEKYADIDDEYMWGDEVLVAPVMTKGARSREVLFPKGEWISWWNPARKYQGGKSYKVQAPLAELPLFVKAGAFIPQYDRDIENVEEYNPQFLTVKYFPAAHKSGYTLFEDDRKSPTSIEDKEYILINFEGEKQGAVTRIGINSEGGYQGMPESRMMELEVVGISAPTAVEWNGNALPKAASRRAIRQYGYLYDAKTRTATLVFPYDYGKAEFTIK